jgi:hypothetical protein
MRRRLWMKKALDGPQQAVTLQVYDDSICKLCPKGSPLPDDSNQMENSYAHQDQVMFILHDVREKFLQEHQRLCPERYP